jgi:hypothetical protein
MAMGIWLLLVDIDRSTSTRGRASVKEEGGSTDIAVWIANKQIPR